MRRIGVFVFFLILLAGIIYRIGFTIDQPYLGMYNRVDFALQNQDTILVLALGNSHAESVDFQTLGIKGGYKLHTGFMDFFETYYLAEYLIPKMKNLKQVYIALSLYMFDVDNSEYDDEYQRSFRKRSYFMTPQFKLIGNDPGNLIQAKLEPIMRPDHWFGVIQYYFKESLINVTKRKSSEERIVSEEFLVKHSINRSKQNAKQVIEMLKSNPHIGIEAEIVMQKLIDLCVRHGVTPVFYTPSYFHEYFNKFDETIKFRNLTRAKDWSKKYGYVYFDFTRDSTLIKRTDVFVDSDHLNQLGREVFSKKLRDSLIIQNELLNDR